MDENTVIQSFTNLLGQTIVDIKYIETKFHYDLSGNWTTVDTDLFVLQSPEWEINLSNGQKWFLTNPQSDFMTELVKSNITFNSSSIAKTDDKTYSAPNSFGWSKVFGQIITAIRFYKRVIKTKSILGFHFSKTYEDNIQIIQFYCSGKTFSITTMDGDIGQMTFYPTGYLGNKLGFFFGKTIAESHTDSGLTMTMEMINEVRFKR